MNTKKPIEFHDSEGNLIGTLDASQHVVMGVRTFEQGIDACIARLHEMNRNTSGRHNFYGHAAMELANLKDSIMSAVTSDKPGRISSK